MFNIHIRSLVRIYNTLSKPDILLAMIYLWYIRWSRRTEQAPYCLLGLSIVK